jgi:putative ABC transport system permease protein
LIAMVLAMVGLYALTAHGVAQRNHEIGVRMALGAQSAQVVWLFVRRTVVQLTLGLALGIAGALAAGGLPFIRDSNPRDPLTLVLVSVLLVGVAVTASVWPARKAARVDPATALRAE